MPKSKAAEKKEEIKVKTPAEEADKIIEIAESDEEVLDDDLALADDTLDDAEDEEGALDEEEVDPFKDKWEE
jgi:hypothetical protein